MAGEISQLIRAKSHTANMYIDTYQPFVNLVWELTKLNLMPESSAFDNHFTLQVVLFEIDCAIFTQIYMNCFVSS